MKKTSCAAAAALSDFAKAKFAQPGPTAAQMLEHRWLDKNAEAKRRSEKGGKRSTVSSRNVLICLDASVSSRRNVSFDLEVFSA